MDNLQALQALEDLLAKVEAGTELDDWVLVMRAFGLRPDDRHISAIEASKGSLDAAKALHEAVLPEWQIETFRLDGEVVLRRTRPVDTHYGFSDGNPARAWLIAILEVLTAEAKGGA